MWDSLHHIYAYEGKLYVPEMARTHAGFYLERDPVVQIEPTDLELHRVLRSAIAKGNPTVRTPKRDQYASMPCVARTAGARTMLVFERRADLWELLVGRNELKVELLDRLPKGGWGGAKQSHVFPNDEEGLRSVVATILSDDKSSDT